MIKRSWRLAQTEDLKTLYIADETARAVLDQFAAFRRNPKASTVDATVIGLTRLGQRYERADVVQVFKKLEEFGFGHFVPGRKGRPSRFEWLDLSVSQVGRLARGEEEGFDKAEPAAPDSAYESEEEILHELVSHRIHLRPGVAAVLTLPFDITPDEAYRLSELVKLLAVPQKGGDV